MTLYNKFNLDEPWDSETNKALIDQMPDVFKSPDVTEAGKTSMHVFTGPGAVFAGDQTLKLSQIVDGLSNTILAVQAGPDTAEIWTKPGGLEFDPENPIKCLEKNCRDLQGGPVRWRCAADPQVDQAGKPCVG
jgi:hypothetical protein